MIDRLLQALAGVFALAGAAIALAVALMVVASIAGRAGWSSPVPGDVELTQLGIGLAISLGLPWCQLHRGHVIVDFFTTRVPVRGRGVLDGIGALLLAAMCALLAWRTGVGALSVREAGETTMILSLPVWPAYAALAPGLALSALIALWQAAGHFSGRALDATAGGEAA